MDLVVQVEVGRNSLSGLARQKAQKAMLLQPTIWMLLEVMVGGIGK